MTVKDLFKISILENATLLAGSKGIQNEIIWFNVMEIIDVVSSLKKGEFLITTGYGFNEDRISKNLIYKLKNGGLSGLGIQLGYYIDKVPSHMIEEADELDFPIVIIPPKITFSMVTKSLYKELTLHKEEVIKNEANSKIENIVFDILKNKKIDILVMHYLENIFFKENDSETYVIQFAISHKYDGFILKADTDKSVGEIKHALGQNRCLVHDEVIMGNFIILFSKPNDVKFMEICNSIERCIHKLSGIYENLIFTVGISSKLFEAADIKRGYYEAVKAQEQLHKIGAARGIIRIEDIDLLNLFLKESTRSDMVCFADKILKPILYYDKDDSEYFKILECYIINNCNISVTSRQLFMHRHTLRNKLEKMNKLFNIDYTNNNSLMKYRIAYIIHNLYK